MKDTVRYLKMVDGSDLITKVREEREDTLEVESPVHMVIAGGGNVIAIPLFPFAKQNRFVLDKSEVKYNFEASDDMVSMWNEKHGSGLTLPPKPGLVLPGK